MLDPTLSDWLDRQADALDRGDADPAALLPRLPPPACSAWRWRNASAAPAARSPTRWAGGRSGGAR